MQEIIQLKIFLVDSNPLIWRQILISANTTFLELHHIIQIAMGWKNCHLFEFNPEGYRIGEADNEDKSFGYGSDKILESGDVKLTDVITQPGEVINYLYDFGDGWAHGIEVEKFHNIDDRIQYPLCIEGQMNCPPEDCGGIASFYYYMEVLKNNKHPEYKNIAQWLGKKYNMEQFDKEKVNLALAQGMSLIKSS